MKIIKTVLKKELKDMFRDKKTVIFSILLPLVLLPVMFGLLGNTINQDEKAVEENLIIAIEDEGNSGLYEFLKSKEQITIVESEDISGDVMEGEILLGISIPSEFDKAMEDEKQIPIEITYDNVSNRSSTAMRIINSYIREFSDSIINKRLVDRNINPTILMPINIVEKTSVKEEESFGKVMLGMMLPLFLMIYSATGTLAAATDLGAGEKERGTLEPLLTTKASRMSLLWGKFLAITVMGAITTVASLIGLYITMQQKGGLFEGAMNGGGLSLTMLPLIGILTLLTTMVFGSIELAISIYARSFKEAQTYLSPITLVAMISAISVYMVDVKSLGIHYFFIPLVNIVALIKELVMGIYNFTHIGITLTWVIVYVVLSISFAKYMFSKEEVIFRT